MIIGRLQQKKWKGEEIVEVNTSDSELSSSSIETESDDDVSMDSASTKNLATPKEQMAADNRTSPRVRFTRRDPSSSVDVSVPLPSVGGG